jgi:hypothetical protein
MRLARVIREAAVEALFVKLGKLRSWIVAKWVSPSWNGVPDRIVLKGIDAAAADYSERFGVSDVAAREMVCMYLAMCIEFVELKAPGRQPTLLQMRRHEQLRKLGFTVTIVDSPEAAEKWYADRS